MLVTCAFGHEEIPLETAVEIEAGGRSAMVCQKCLELITVHRRYHRMDLEKLVPRMAD